MYSNESIHGIAYNTDPTISGIATCFSNQDGKILDKINTSYVKKPCFEDNLTGTIIPDNEQKFKDDSVFKMLTWFWSENLTHKDGNTINNPVITKIYIVIPKTFNKCNYGYACPMNKECNSMPDGIFKSTQTILIISQEWWNTTPSHQYNWRECPYHNKKEFFRANATNALWHCMLTICSDDNIKYDLHSMLAEYCVYNRFISFICVMSNKKQKKNHQVETEQSVNSSCQIRR